MEPCKGSLALVPVPSENLIVCYPAVSHFQLPPSLQVSAQTLPRLVLAHPSRMAFAAVAWWEGRDRAKGVLRLSGPENEGHRGFRALTAAFSLADQYG